MKINGFTLAEALITLAIVGIAAAMTIPSISASRQKTELEVRFVKNYRALNEVVNLSVAQHGGFQNWEWKDSFSNGEKDEFVKKYLLPYLNVAKFCNADSPSVACFYNIKYKTPDGKESGVSGTGNPKVILADGTAIVFSFKNNCITNKHRCLTFDVDINGRKGPNILGQDLFGYEFRPLTSEFTPHGLLTDAYDEASKSYVKRTYEEINQLCQSGGTNAWFCAAKVVADGFKINY